jgi:hypothetical protein
MIEATRHKGNKATRQQGIKATRHKGIKQTAISVVNLHFQMLTAGCRLFAFTFAACIGFSIITLSHYHIS